MRIIQDLCNSKKWKNYSYILYGLWSTFNYLFLALLYAKALLQILKCQNHNVAQQSTRLSIFLTGGWILGISEIAECHSASVASTSWGQIILGTFGMSVAFIYHSIVNFKFRRSIRIRCTLTDIVFLHWRTIMLRRPEEAVVFPSRASTMLPKDGMSSCCSMCRTSLPRTTLSSSNKRC